MEKEKNQQGMPKDDVDMYVSFLTCLLAFFPVKFYALIDSTQKKENIESGQFLNYVKFLPVIVLCGEKYIIIKLFKGYYDYYSQKICAIEKLNLSILEASSTSKRI